MRFIRHSLIGLFMAALTLGLLVWAGALVRDAVTARMADDTGGPPVRERVFTVPVLTARSETVAPVLQAYGQVQSQRTLELRAAVGGQVIELDPAFVEGGRVVAGQVLLRLDPADAADALARAEADLADAMAERRDAARAVTLAEADLAAAEEQAALRARAVARQQGLADRQVGTEAAMETAELAASSARQAALSRAQALAQAEARVDQAATQAARAEIALAEARRRLADTTITAPFDGVLTGVTLVAGRLVSANERLAALVDDTALEVAFRLSTAQYARLLDAAGGLPAHPATVALDLGGVDLTSPAQLTRAAAAVGEGLTGRMVFAAISAPRGLQPGDFVTVTVTEPPLAEVIRLPALALDAAGRVLVLDAEDRLREMPVVLERRQGDNVLVRAPDLAGREVVAERTPLIGPGVRINPLRIPGTAAATPAPAAEMPASEASSPTTPTATTPVPTRPGGSANALPPDTAAAAQGLRPAPEDAALVALTPERRARLIAYVTATPAMPDATRARLLAQLQQDQVPQAMVERLERRMGG